MKFLPRLLALAAAFTAALSLSAKPLTVGFAQTGAESAWRTANTTSLKSEAEKRGINLKFSDGQGKQENQIRAVRSFITQGVDAILIAPIVETGWEPVLREARRAKIPVILMDRTVKVSDDSLFTCFVGSDFAEEGRMAADWLAKQTNGKGRILELQGTPGSAPANERRRAFAEAIAKYPEPKAAISVVPAARKSWKRFSKSTDATSRSSMRTTTTWPSARSKPSRKPA